MGGGREHHTIEVIGTTLATGAKGTNFRSWVYDEEGISGCIDVTMYKQPKQIDIHILEKEIRNDGMVNTLDSVQKDNLLAVEVREATSKGYAVARGGRDAVNFSMPGSKTRRGRVGVDMANTLDTSCNQGIFVQISEELTVYAVWYPKKECYVAIRKLTPKECFRLQGWTDDYFEKAQFVNSDSQLYKQAGNGVTVSVIKAIADRMVIK